MQGKYELAKENYDKGLALEPDYPSLRNNYGLMQLASGDLQGALATFSALVDSPQANDRYRLNRALVELAMGQTEAALADAPTMDESGLQQTLAIYRAPAQDNASSNPDSARHRASASADDGQISFAERTFGGRSPGPPPRLRRRASIKPAAGLTTGQLLPEISSLSAKVAVLKQPSGVVNQT